MLKRKKRELTPEEEIQFAEIKELQALRVMVRIAIRILQREKLKQIETENEKVLSL